MAEYKSRKEVPDKYKWDLTEYFKSEDEYNSIYDKAKQQIDLLKDYKGTIKDPDKLYEFLNIFIETYGDVEDLFGYAYLVNDIELGNSKNIERLDKITKLDTTFSINTVWFDNELLKLSKDEYQGLFNMNPNLNKYKFFLDEIYKDKDYIIDDDKQSIVTSLINAMNSYQDIYSNLINSEIDYGKVTIDGKETQITIGNRRRLMKNDDVEVRKQVYYSFGKEINKHANTFASLLNSYVNMTNTNAKIHNFSGEWEKHLHEEDFSDKVFKTLVEFTEKHTKSLHKYYDLYKKVFNLDKLYSYDLARDLVNNNTKYTIEEAQKLILDSIKPLGDDYYKKFSKIFAEKYIDYCEYKGKCSGGYSISTINHNSRILMNYNDDLQSVSTIIHEGGHNVHHQYVKENNPKQYRGVSLFVAEIASLTNECLLSFNLMNNGKTKEEKLSGIDNLLNIIINNYFGAVMEGKIEEDMYELVSNNGMITKDFMQEESKKYLAMYQGKDFVIDEYNINNWTRRSHYYSSFYLYSYSICIATAVYVASKIIDNDSDMLDKYIKFLSTGGDVIPYKSFMTLGVDLEEDTVYKNLIKVFESLIDKFNEIYESEE